MNEKKFNMPSPADLAKKSSTSNISLRVETEAVDIFNMLAKKEGVKPGTMMVNLLETYAYSYRDQVANGTVSVDVMRAFLDNIAEKLSKMNDDALMARLYKDDETTILHIFGWDDIGEFEWLWDNYLSDKWDEQKDDIPAWEIGDESFYAARFSPTRKNQKPKMETITEIIGDSVIDSYYIPTNNWKLVANILFEYEKKMEDVFPKQKVIINKDIARAIYEVACKEKDRKILAKEIAKILADYVESQYE